MINKCAYCPTEISWLKILNTVKCVGIYIIFLFHKNVPCYIHLSNISEKGGNIVFFALTMRNLRHRKYMALAGSYIVRRVGMGAWRDLLIQYGCSLDKASGWEEAFEVQKGIWSVVSSWRRGMYSSGPPWDRAVSPDNNGKL